VEKGSECPSPQDTSIDAIDPPTDAAVIVRVTVCPTVMLVLSSVNETVGGAIAAARFTGFTGRLLGLPYIEVVNGP
jgi:hypothetical protein